MTTLRPGDPLEIRALQSNGNAYRWWTDTIVAVDRETIVTSSPIGRHVNGPGGGWDAWYSGRAVYWSDRPYNLAEIFHLDGSLIEIYVHIASPARLYDCTPEFQASCYRSVAEVLGMIENWRV